MAKARVQPSVILTNHQPILCQTAKARLLKHVGAALSHLALALPTVRDRRLELG